MTLLKRTGVVAATLSLLSLAACGGNDDADTTDKSSGPVTLQFWGWAPGYEDSVKLFNDSHTDIKVEFSQISPGSQGGYTKLLNAAKAGNAPCLAQVGFETLPSFAAAGALEVATDAAEQYAGDFSEWTWGQSTIGGHTYAIPVDIAPMALIYRKDLFEKYGVTEAPTTWAEYEADAEKIHKANPKAYIGYFGNDAYNFSGLAWQAGAKWFGTEGDEWQVNINDEATTKVADFWQGLVDKDLVKAVPSFDTALYKGMGDGTILSDVNAVWDTPIVADSVKGSSGKWAVAPMPVWDESEPSYGNAGGSPNAVLKGCEHVAEAAEFAHWFATDEASVTNLIKNTGIFPAATSGLANPELTKPNPFYGGQVIFDVFNDAVAGIDPAFTWGPVMTKTSAVLGDGLGKVGAKSTTLPSVLDDAQTQTVDEMKAQGLSVSE